VETVYFAEFTPSSDPGYVFASGSHDHLKFWELQGRTLRPRPALYSNVGVQQTMLCGGSLGPRFASGAVSGHMYIWKGRVLEKVGLASPRHPLTPVPSAPLTRPVLRCWRHVCPVQVIRAHDQAVTTMSSCVLGMVTGSKDGYVKLWGPHLEHLRSYDLAEAPVPPLKCVVCSTPCTSHPGHICSNRRPPLCSMGLALRPSASS
jgi:hypothetical protein